MDTINNNTKVIDFVKKMAEDKKMVRAYMRGEISKNDLDAKGIKLAMPI